MANSWVEKPTTAISHRDAALSTGSQYGSLAGHKAMPSGLFPGFVIISSQWNNGSSPG